MAVYSQKMFLTAASVAYAQDLKGSPAEDYLLGRGVSLHAACTARLGFVNSPQPGHEQYARMLAIPYWTMSGVEAIKFRVIDDRGGARYLWPQGQKSRLYNTEAVISGAPYVVICEGELDTVTAHYVCGLNAVGIAGVQHWKPHHQRVLRGFGSVFIVCDNDDKEDGNPGQDLAHRIQRDIPHARNISLPRGCDITDYVEQFGHNALPELLGITVSVG